MQLDIGGDRPNRLVGGFVVEPQILDGLGRVAAGAIDRGGFGDGAVDVQIVG
jgi:hypothetical protein